MGIITIRQYKNIFLINRTDKGLAFWKVMPNDNPSLKMNWKKPGEMGLQAFDISKSLLSDAAKLSWFRNSAGLCTALMPWRADRGKKWGGRRKGCRRFF